MNVEFLESSVGGVCPHAPPISPAGVDICRAQNHGTERLGVVAEPSSVSATVT